MPKLAWSNPELLRQLAEDAVKRQRPTRSAEMAHPRLLHELDVHATELEMQNEALREAQRELEASRAEYRNLFELAPVAYVTVDGQGRIAAANEAAAVLFDMPKQDILGIRLARFVSAAEAEVFELHRREVISSTARIRSKFTLARADGSTRIAMFESQCTDSVVGEWRTVLVDTTERTVLERRLEQVERLGALGTQASGIVHDFKNVLATIPV